MIRKFIPRACLFIFALVVGAATALGQVGPGGSSIPVPLPVQDSSGGTFTTVTNAVNGAALTVPLQTTPQDDATLSGTCTSACGNVVLFSQDMLGYNSSSVQLTANASGNTITFQTCDDTSVAQCVTDSAWQSLYCAPINQSGSAGSTTVTATTSATTPILYTCPKRGRFFQITVTTYVSGTVTITGHVHVYPYQPLQTVAAAINGPLGSQTTSNGVATTPTGYGYTHISTDTTTTPKSGAGMLHAICINTVAPTATITIYDNTAASGSVIGVPLATAQGCLTYDVNFSTGLTIVTAVATADITVSYR